MKNRVSDYITLIALFVFGMVLALPFTGSAAGFPSVHDLVQRPRAHTLALYNTHTARGLEIDYRAGDRYSPDALAAINYLLRDHRNGKVHEIDPALLDVLYDMKAILEKRHPGLEVRYDIVSGYRSQETNEMLRKAGGGQGKRSQHIEGKALDIRVEGIDAAELRDTAWCLQRGGVGFYRGKDFIHVDTGTVRYWNWKPTAETCAGYEAADSF